MTSTRLAARAALLGLALLASVPAFGQTRGVQPSGATANAPNDYSRDTSWLCRPGRRDACSVDLTTSVVQADGSVSREAWSAATDQHIPLCREASQIGCLVTYVSYRSTSPPPANTRFGDVTEDGMVAACTNPAALARRGGALHAYLDAAGRLIAGESPGPWVVSTRPVDAPWVSPPGLLSAQCTSNEHAAYLEVTVHADPSDPGADDIQGDLVVAGQILGDWGLHLVDVNLAMGNLVGRGATGSCLGGTWTLTQERSISSGTRACRRRAPSPRPRSVPQRGSRDRPRTPRRCAGHPNA